MKTIISPLHRARGYRYVDEGPATERPPVVLLHGLLGNVDNWASTVQTLSAQSYRVLVPVLPFYTLPMKQSHLPGVVDHLRGFVEALGLGAVVLAGNSLGGHVALLYALRYPEGIAALVLAGSSGIYEVEMGTTTLRRRDRDYIRARGALTFYDPAHVTDALVEDAYTLANDRGAALRLIRMARSAQAETVADQLARIAVPTQLIWGRNDQITPPDVAEAFRTRIPHAELHFLDRCGHAPMIERPVAFNRMLLSFLAKAIGTAALTASPGVP